MFSLTFILVVFCVGGLTVAAVIAAVYFFLRDRDA
jgi:hypothetical protein